MKNEWKIIFKQCWSPFTANKVTFLKCSMQISIRAVFVNGKQLVMILFNYKVYIRLSKILRYGIIPLILLKYLLQQHPSVEMALPPDCQLVLSEMCPHLSQDISQGIDHLHLESPSIQKENIYSQLNKNVEQTAKYLKECTLLWLSLNNPMPWLDGEKTHTVL